MKSMVPFRYLLAAFLLLSSYPVTAQMNVWLLDTLQFTLEKFQNSLSMKGVASAVVFPDGSVWSGAAGEYGTTPLQADILFDAGSNTKSMVAATILLLEEEGKLTIEDTLYQHISAIQHVPNGITLRQLMEHRSGVYSYTNHPDFATEINGDPTQFWEPDSLMKYFMDAPSFPVGSSWEYSNTNYILLGKVIEAVEGKPLHEVFDEKLFVPLNLEETYLDQYQPYTQTKVGAWLTNGSYLGIDFVSFMSSAWAAGGIVCTPEDLASWAYQLFSGGFLSSASMTELTTGTNLGGSTIYGLGVMKETYKTREYLLHGGTTLQNSEMHYSLSSDFAVVTMNIDQGYIGQTNGLQKRMIDVLEHEVDRIISDVEEPVGAETIRIAPNPSADIIQIKTGTTQSYKINVFDLKGTLVFTQTSDDPLLTLRKEDIGSGMFVLSIRSENELPFSTKIVFQ